jgi:hypothetical protein
MPVAAFTSLGNNAKDLLYGSAKAGKYQYDKVLNVSSKTADGVEFTVNAVGKDDKLDMALKGAYAANKYNVTATLAQSGKLAVAVAYKELVPGLTLGLTGNVPDTDSAKLGIDYTGVPHLLVKSSVSLTAAPKVDVAVTSGLNDVTVGGEVSYDAAKSAITKWTVGVGYTASDYQAALLYNDAQKGGCLVVTVQHDSALRSPACSTACCWPSCGLQGHQVDRCTRWPAHFRPAMYAADLYCALVTCLPATATALLSHRVTADTTIGAEVVRDLAANTTSFAAGLSKQQAGGALTKLKLDNAGIVSVLYEQVSAESLASIQCTVT